MQDCQIYVCVCVWEGGLGWGARRRWEWGNEREASFFPHYFFLKNCLVEKHFDLGMPFQQTT